MAQIIAGQTNAISERFLRRLIAFYWPRPSTKETTQFDIGYEQAKRDLRAIVAQEIEHLAEYEPKQTQQPVRARWFGLLR